jgi:hypothetical protein
MKRKGYVIAVIVVSALILQPYTALASCSSYTRSGPDGKIQLCTRCCTSSGICDEHCF